LVKDVGALMGSLNIIHPGNLLDAGEQYIVHQTNCVSPSAAGLAALIFQKWPESDIYSKRWEFKGEVFPGHEPGNIVITGDGEKERYVIHAMGQLYPGTGHDWSSNDSSKIREKYFEQCLEKIAAIPDMKSIAFPWQIGCGLAGGHWPTYLQLIDQFADTVKARVSVYRRAQD
jgi:O-acetyl-ADP-ribose deacetylase (regulator of RNase III)